MVRQCRMSTPATWSVIVRSCIFSGPDITILLQPPIVLVVLVGPVNCIATHNKYTRTKERLAGPASVTVTTGNLSLANENEKAYHRLDGRPSRKIYKQREPRGEEQRELPVTPVSSRWKKLTQCSRGDGRNYNCVSCVAVTMLYYMSV